MSDTTYQGIPEAAREFCYMASAPSLNVPNNVVVNDRGMSWELPTVAEMMKPDYKPRNVNIDGSWIPS